MATETVGENSADTYSGSTNIDSSIQGGVDATNNFGAQALEAFNFDNKVPILQFGEMSNISASATVSAATFYIYNTLGGYDYGSVDWNLHRCLRDWVELEVTWTIWKTSNNWSTA